MSLFHVALIGLRMFYFCGNHLVCTHVSSNTQDPRDTRLPWCYSSQVMPFHESFRWPGQVTLLALNSRLATKYVHMMFLLADVEQGLQFRCKTASSCGLIHRRSLAISVIILVLLHRGNWTCYHCRQWHAEIVSQYRRSLGFPTHDETST